MNTHPASSPEPKRPITWLHLSDLHLCKSKTGWDADRILQFLIEDLKRMEADHGLNPDLLLVTGDLVFGHLGEGDLSIESQFEEVWYFLKRVREAFNTPIPAKRVFLAPGNHDVDRRRVLDSQRDWLDKLGAKPEDVRFVNQMLNDATGEWPGLMERLDAYKQFLREHYPHLLPDEEAEKRLCHAHTLDIHGHRLGIACLNSAWSCCRNAEKGRLWLGGEWQLRELGKKLQEEGAEIKLAMAHHPLNWLGPGEDPKLTKELQQGFHFFLHGHEHFSWVAETPNHIRLSAGACYGKEPAESGYSFARLNPFEATGEVWFRRFEDEESGWVPYVIEGRADERGRWSFALEWLMKAKDAIADAGDTPTEPPTDPPALSPDSPGAPETRAVFGRGREIEELAKKLQETFILLVHGMAGIGKSCLIEEVHRALGHIRPGEGEEYKLVPLRATPHLGADEIFGQLAPVLKCFDEDPKAPRQLGRLDLKALAKYRGAPPTVFHLYRAHTAFAGHGFIETEVGIFLGGLVKQLPQFRVIIESTRAAPTGLFPDGEYHVHRVRGLDVDAVQAYFRRPFVKNPRQGWELTEEQALEIYQRLGGKNKKDGAHPLGMALLAVVADSLGMDPARVLERHPGTLRKELEEKLFHDLYEKVLTPPQQHLLRLAALYRQPIPVGHEAALDGRAGKDGAFQALAQRFLLSPDEREERFELHSLFAELTQDRIDAGSFEYQLDHGVIAEAWLATVRGIKTRRLPYILAANEAAFHLLEAEEFHRLRELSVSLLGRDTPGILAAWSDRLHAIGDREGLRPVLELLTKLLPDEPKYHRFLGETIEKLDGRGAEEALKHYLKAFELPPIVPQNLANLGHCWLARREPEAFIALLDGLTEFERQRAVNAHVHDIHAKCREQMGDGGQASRIRQEQIRQGTRNPAIYNDEADYLGKLERYPEALAVLDQAERAGVMDDHLWAVKAGILQADNQGEAASQLRRGRMAAGTQNAAFYNDEALYQWQERGDPDAALAVLDEADKNRCANDHILAVKARLLEAMERGAEASELRWARINAGTRHAAFYNDEAVWLRERGDRGDFAAALAVLELARKNGCADEYTHTIRRSIEQRQRQTPP